MNKEYLKNYRDEHKEDTKKYNAEYYQKTRAALIEKNKNNKVVCEICNRSISSWNKSAHKKSDIHLAAQKIKDLEKIIADQKEKANSV
jgi:hypothetical protein